MSWLDKVLKYEMNLGDFEEKLDLFRTYQKYVYMVMVVGTVIYMAVGMVWQDYSKYRVESKVLRDVQDILEDRRRKVLDKENIERELVRLKGVVEEKQQLFFTQQSITEFSINTLPALADDCGVKLTFRTYKEPVQEGEFIVYPISISAQGSFKAMVQFFYTLENYPKVVKIKDLDVNRQSAGPVVLSFKMTLGAYAL